MTAQQPRPVTIYDIRHMLLTKDVDPRLVVSPTDIALANYAARDGRQEVLLITRSEMLEHYEMTGDDEVDAPRYAEVAADLSQVANDLRAEMF